MGGVMAQITWSMAETQQRLDALRKTYPRGAKAAAVEPEEPAAENKAPRTRRYVPLMAAAGILLFCFTFGEIALPRIMPPGWGLFRHGNARPTQAASEASMAPSLEELDTRLLEAAVRDALEEHLALKGAYPASLETLVSNELLSRKLFEEVNSRGFDYRINGGGSSYSFERGRP